MQLAVVDATQRHNELVANLAAKGARLPKPDVMGIGRTPAADKARLGAHEVPMRFIAFADRLYESDCMRATAFGLSSFGPNVGPSELTMLSTDTAACNVGAISPGCVSDL